MTSKDKISFNTWTTALLTLGLLSALNYQSYFTSKTQIGTGSTRSPASTQETKIVEVISMDCKSQTTEIPSSLQMIRLSLPNCTKEDLPKIRNLTNGHTASIFALKKTISSDFIRLNQGPNEIEVLWADKSKQVVTLNRTK